MFTPNFNQDQYVDADSFNAAAGSVSGSIASGLIASCFPGLVNDNNGSYTASGLLVSAYLPAPFGVIFGTGILANAHGVATGADTQTYVINFSGLVPVSGSPVTAYGVASYQQIQQTAIAITGPPPGHPDYNPNFVPYTGYQTNVDSLAVSATTIAPDNSTTFELFRTTLTSGITTLGALNTTFQRRRAPHAIFSLQTPAVTGILSAEFTNYLSVSGTYTLPAASISNTQLLTAVSMSSGTCTIAVSESDLIYGYGINPASGIPSFTITSGNVATLGAINGIWQLFNGTAGVVQSQPILTQSVNYYVSSSGSDSNAGTSAAFPWLTLSHAASVVSTINTNGYTITVNVAAGTYTQGFALPGVFGGGNVVLLATNGTPTNTVISTTNLPCVQITGGGSITVNGFQLIAEGGTSPNRNGILTSGGGSISLANCDLNTCTDGQLAASGGGTISVQNQTITVSAGGGSFLNVNIAGNINIDSATINFTHTGITYINTVFANNGGHIDGVVTAFTGTGVASVVGTRYLAVNGGSIYTAGGGANWFPGNAAGNAASGYYT